jgi:glycosyltransferase involved in cell wall biosynthesis
MRIAVLLPCYNEGGAIFNVVQSFKETLPTAAIYVYDNNSTDDTAAEARAAGADVRHEPRQGKGHVVRRMFADIDADIYLMADGDGTYDVASAPALIQLLCDQHLDMVVGARQEQCAKAHRVGHKLGNNVFNIALRILFKSPFKDIFSGYRVFSRRFVKTFPALTSGFDIETEMAIHALHLHIPFAEVETPFFERVEGTQSKLSTFKDGFKILWRMLYLFKEFKPMLFFGGVSFVLLVAATLLAYPLVRDFLATGLVPRFPTAVLCTGMALGAGLSLVCGFILDSVSRMRKEMLRLAYAGMARF